MFAQTLEETVLTRTLLTVPLPTFDLSYLVEQLLNKPETLAWSPARFSMAVNDYRSFLATAKMEPQGKQQPSPDVDVIWHRHILNTRRYIQDCMSYFGHYYHHNPLPSKLCDGGQCDGDMDGISKNCGVSNNGMKLCDGGQCDGDMDGVSKVRFLAVTCEGTGGGGGDDNSIKFGSEYGNKL